MTAATSMSSAMQTWRLFPKSGNLSVQWTNGHFLNIPTSIARNGRIHTVRRFRFMSGRYSWRWAGTGKTQSQRSEPLSTSGVWTGYSTETNCRAQGLDHLDSIGRWKEKAPVFVLNEPGEGEEVVLASVCSMRPRADTTCLLHPGDHSFIGHESYVDYGLCRTDQKEHLEHLIQSGYFVRREDASEELIERIINGAFESRHTKPKILDLLE